MLDEAEKMKEDAINLLQYFLNKGPFTEDVSATDALTQIDIIKKQLKELRERETRLRKDLGVFDLSILEPMEMQILEKVYT